MMIDNLSLIANQIWNSAISASFKMHAQTFPSFVRHHFIWFLCAQFGRNPSMTSICGHNSSFPFSYDANEMECNTMEKIVVKRNMIRLQESQTKKYPMIQSCIHHYKLRPCLLHNYITCMNIDQNHHFNQTESSRPPYPHSLIQAYTSI